VSEGDIRTELDGMGRRMNAGSESILADFHFSISHSRELIQFGSSALSHSDSVSRDERFYSTTIGPTSSYEFD
jgi:hypothetical protein